MKFKTYVKIEPKEWLPLAAVLIIVCLIMSGRMDDAMRFLKDCLPLVGK